MKFVTFLRKNSDLPERVVDFLLERDTFRNKIMEIVADFDEKSYNNGKPWKSSRILRVKPNFFIFLHFSFFFLKFFHLLFISFFHVFVFIFTLSSFFHCIVFFIFSIIHFSHFFTIFMFFIFMFSFFVIFYSFSYFDFLMFFFFLIFFFSFFLKKKVSSFLFSCIFSNMFFIAGISIRV